MSLGNDPSQVPSQQDVEAGEALAAARQERHELGRHGRAPSTESILREMGRGPDGYPIPEGPDEWISASEAGRRALEDLQEEQPEQRPITDGGQLHSGELYNRISEAYHEYGDVRCDGCGELIDLSEADDVDEAVGIWNDHAQEVNHGE